MLASFDLNDIFSVEVFFVWVFLCLVCCIFFFFKWIMPSTKHLQSSSEFFSKLDLPSFFEKARQRDASCMEISSVTGVGLRI